MNFCCFHGNQYILYSEISFKLNKGNDCFLYYGRKCCYNQIKLNFTDILAVAREWLFHGLPCNHYFTDVKISDFLQQEGLMCLILLN